MLPHGLPLCAAYRLQRTTARDNSPCWPALQTTPLHANGRQVCRAPARACCKTTRKARDAALSSG